MAARPAQVRRRRGRLAAIGRQWGWMLAVLIVVGFVGAVAVVANGRGAPGEDVASGSAATTPTSAAGPGPPPVATVKRRGPTPTQPGQLTAPPGYATVLLSALPPEAAQTWQLVERGGPFPRREDGVAFDNSGGRLPAQPLGWYRSYTVPTPGDAGPGARRLVVGQDRMPYWSADGGGSFAFVDVTR